MSDIETVVRESMDYQGGLHALPSAPLIRRARRRRLAQGLGATALTAGCATAAIAVAASMQQSGTQPVAVDPATSASTSPTSPAPSPSAQTVATDAIPLQATDRVTTPDGALIVVDPEQLCVGNTHKKPSCLIGADPTLDSPSSAFGWYTTSPKDFVYAWLTPEGTTNATLKVGDAAPTKAALYQVEGRRMLIAVVTGATCWTDSVGAELESTDAVGETIYVHSAGGTCPDSLPESNRG